MEEINENDGMERPTTSTEELPPSDSNDVKEFVRRTFELPEEFIEANDPVPSVSPRDNLSYKEDKKAWKDLKAFDEKNGGFNKLIFEMRLSILHHKPDDILNFIIEDFFAERNLKRLRDLVNTKK
jgi:hypothetical protein